MSPGILLGDTRFREDLSSVVDILLLKDDDMKFLSLVNFLPKIADIFGKKVTSQKHEWLDDAARAEQITAIASGSGVDWDTDDDITNLPLVAAQGLKLRIGDVLLLPDAGGEIVIVKAIAVAGTTIDLYARGHGSTAAAAQGTASLTIKIIGNAQIENGDPLSADFTTPTEGYNYTQIFEDVAEVSGTSRRSKYAQGDYLGYSVAKKLKEALKSLNRAMWEGVRNLDTTNKIGTLGGIREFGSDSSNVAGALSLAKIYTAMIVHIDAGLFPSAIHGSPTTIGDIEQLINANVRQKTSETKGGMSVATVSIMGHDVELHMDRHARSSEFMILDYNRVAYGPLAGGEFEDGNFAAYPIWSRRNGKQIAIQVLGEFTMRVSNGGSTRAYGIT